jgi:hypothetical protein
VAGQRRLVLALDGHIAVEAVEGLGQQGGQQIGPALVQRQRGVKGPVQILVEVLRPARRPRGVFIDNAPAARKRLSLKSVAAVGLDLTQA